MAVEGPIRAWSCAGRRGDASLLAGPEIAAQVAEQISDMLESLGRLGPRWGRVPVAEGRAAVRRVRANLATFRSLFDADWVSVVRRGLQPVGEALAEISRRDGVHDLLEELAERADVRGAVTAVMRASVEQRQALVTEAIATVARAGGPRLAGVLGTAAVVGPPLALHPDANAWLPAAEVLPGLVRKPWRNLRRISRQLDVPDRLEQLRTTARQVRYAAEATGELLGPHAIDLAEQAARLQLLLRGHHDAAALLEWLAALPVAQRDGTLGHAVHGLHDTLEREANAALPDVLAHVVAAGERLEVPGRARPVRAAGGVVWRRHRDGVEVVVVHRPSTGDWSLPKGKAALGEPLEACAVRETAEETGLVCSPGRELLTVTYRDGRGFRKFVTYYEMTARHAEATAASTTDEVDEVEWLALTDASARVSRARDRRVLDALASRVDEPQ